MAAILFKSKYADIEDIKNINFDNNVHKIVAQYILGLKDKDETLRVSSLFEIFDEDTPELNEIFNLSYGEHLTDDNAHTYYTDCLNVIRKDILLKQLELLKNQIKTEDNLAKRRELTIKINNLMLEIKK
jgi:hypothetical protein